MREERGAVMRKNVRVDPESFTQNYREYLEKLASGRVLGMVDQWWQFVYDVNDSLERMTAMGCGYVPLPITMANMNICHK